MPTALTKRGNGYLRCVLVQAAWSMVRSRTGGSLKERYVYLTKLQGKSKKKTIVSIARRLAELMYAVLREKTAYEVRAWKGPALNHSVSLARKDMSA